MSRDDAAWVGLLLAIAGGVAGLVYAHGGKTFVGMATIANKRILKEKSDDYEVALFYNGKIVWFENKGWYDRKQIGDRVGVFVSRAGFVSYAEVEGP